MAKSLQTISSIFVKIIKTENAQHMTSCAGQNALLYAGVTLDQRPFVNEHSFCQMRTIKELQALVFSTVRFSKSRTSSEVFI